MRKLKDTTKQFNQRDNMEKCFPFSFILFVIINYRGNYLVYKLKIYNMFLK